jgi:hypothetical protein
LFSLIWSLLFIFFKHLLQADLSFLRFRFRQCMVPCRYHSYQSLRFLPWCGQFQGLIGHFVYHIDGGTDTKVTPGNAFTAVIMSGQTQSHFVASIISVIREDWIGEERGRSWKSCCGISIVANAKYYGDTRMKKWRRYCREGEKDRSDISRAIMNCLE